MVGWKWSQEGQLGGVGGTAAGKGVHTAVRAGHMGPGFRQGPISPSWATDSICLLLSLFFIPYFDTGLQKLDQLANVKKALPPRFPFVSQRRWPLLSLPMGFTCPSSHPVTLSVFPRHSILSLSLLAVPSLFLQFRSLTCYKTTVHRAYLNTGQLFTPEKQNSKENIERF